MRAERVGHALHVERLSHLQHADPTEHLTVRGGVPWATLGRQQGATIAPLRV